MVRGKSPLVLPFSTCQWKEPLRAGNPWMGWSTKNQEDFAIWLFECDDQVNGHVSKRWDHAEFIELLSIIPHGERVQPGPLIAVPQEVATVTSI